MSMSLFFLPVAVGIIVAAEDYLSPDFSKSIKDCATMDTRFNDSKILLKTLHEYGLCPKQLAPDKFVVDFLDGTIIYQRSSSNTPFTMSIQNIKDMDKLLKELADIEQVYNGNVQEYTYQRVLNNLPNDMTIESEEVMEDDSILITLNV